ncbi:MAG: hypothetical protein JXA93_19045 [Anaerolineae bacterium]|nr:hypothetical protein [Anaerolineae bacterium]
MRGTSTSRRRFIVVAAVVIVLLLSTVASAQPGGSYTVEEGTIAGGSYRLNSVGPQAGEPMSGGGYQLLSSVRSPALRGSGCCCTYLPCVLRGW